MEERLQVTKQKALLVAAGLLLALLGLMPNYALADNLSGEDTPKPAVVVTTEAPSKTAPTNVNVDRPPAPAPAQAPASAPAAVVAEPQSKANEGSPSEAAPQDKSEDAANAIKTVSPQDVAPLPLLGTDIAPPAASVVETPAIRMDLWARIRQGYALTPLDNNLVRKWEQHYIARPDYLNRMFERGGRYLFHIVEEVERRQLPAELALLPFIESAFNPQAMSSARASGMWQFMPATGRSFDLRQNIFRDDRRSVLDSTRAALDYLNQLHGMFKDWHLALAAYNWGQGNVGKALAHNRRVGQSAQYEHLSMPEETRNYIPKLQAIINIVSRPEQFGFQLPPLENHPYFLTVSVDRDMDVSLAAKLAKLSLDEFRALNPQLNKPVILASGTPKLLLPFDNAREFERDVKAHRGAFATWTAWVAPATFSLAEISKRVGMSESQLREINRIPPKMLVKVGSTLLVPRLSDTTRDVPERVADVAAILLTPEAQPARRMVVKAGPKGETVAAVAQRYRVTATQLASWNSVSATGKFKPGEQVVLHLKAAAPSKQRVAAQPAASKAVPATARNKKSAPPRQTVRVAPRPNAVRR
jgi:membrane-bound lytic murein transglycosylase D